MVEFYDGVMQLRARAADHFVDDFPWANLTLEDFHTPKPTLPSSNGILSGFPHAMTADEIWEKVGGAQYEFDKGVAAISVDMDAQMVDLSRDWKNEAAEAVSNMSFTFDLDDFDPPRFDTVELSIEGDPDGGVAYVDASFKETAAAFASTTMFFLDSLGLPGFNIFFPWAPPLESNFTVGKASTVVASPIEYTFEAFAACIWTSAAGCCRW